MAKFLTEIKLNEFVSSRFEAESAKEVLSIMRQFMGEETAADSEALSATPPKRRGRPPKSGVVGVITPAGAAAVIDAANEALDHARGMKDLKTTVVRAPEIGDVYGAGAPAQPWSEEAKAAGPDFAYIIYTTLAEISDAIRNYARLPNVGVPGVTSLIREFKTADGAQAQQVKQIAESEYKALSRRLAELTAS
jgi:hypothetical protein